MNQLLSAAGGRMHQLQLWYARKYETLSVGVIRVIGAYFLDLGVFQTAVRWFKHGI
jgi:hypothetical protein